MNRLPSLSAYRTRSLAPTALVLVAGAIIVIATGNQYTGSVFVLAVCYAIVTAGMAVQIGFSQQIAFSQSVFMGAGAYGVAMLNTHDNLSVLEATPIVLVASALVALVLGSVVTRASGCSSSAACSPRSAAPPTRGRSSSCRRPWWTPRPNSRC